MNTEAWSKPERKFLPCPFCGTPQENCYLIIKNREQQEGHPIRMVFCISCSASAPAGIWNQRFSQS